MKKLIALLLLPLPLLAQSYFSPVAPTGLPYIVIVEQIRINGQTPAAGTEIAVFDDTLCVGALVIGDSTNNSIITWQGNSSLSLPGFSPGDSMRFQGYIPSTGKVIPLRSVFSTGDGTFGFGTFSVISLSYDEPSSLKGETGGRYNGKVSVFPNPSNGDFFLKFAGFETGISSIRIYSITGEMVHESQIEITSVDLEKRFTSFTGFASGEYIIEIDSGRRPVFEKFILVR